MIAIIALTVIAVYAIVALLITWWLIAVTWKKARKKSTPWMASTASIAFFLLLPVWDILIEYAYMQHLCAKDGGPHVYQRVMLDAKYFDEKGYPKLKYTDKETLKMCVGNRCFISKSDRNNVFSIYLGKRDGERRNAVRRSIRRYIDPQSGEIVGEYVRYLHRTRYDLSGAAKACPAFIQNDYNQMMKSIFHSKAISNKPINN